MPSLVGLIGEHRSDTDVLSVFIDKLAPSKRFRFQKVSSNGGGKIRGKCRQWAQLLSDRGCAALVVAQDLDNNDLSALTAQLTAALHPSPIANYCIVIPVRMIEAWLLTDSEAIKKALNLARAPGMVPNPESLRDPKTKLGEIIYERSRKTRRYLSTVHNRLIAEQIEVTKLSRCNSFDRLRLFVTQNL